MIQGIEKSVSSLAFLVSHPHGEFSLQGSLFSLCMQLFGSKIAVLASEPAELTISKL